MFELQTAIATIDKAVMEDLLFSQFHVHGVSAEVACCTYKGVPLYLIRCNNGVSYVCTRGQALYFMKQMYYVPWHLYEDASAFRVYPKLDNIQHASRGAQFGVHYISIAKSHDYATPAVLPI
jgi:hypothetical protein